MPLTENGLSAGAASLAVGAAGLPVFPVWFCAPGSSGSMGPENRPAGETRKGRGVPFDRRLVNKRKGGAPYGAPPFRLFIHEADPGLHVGISVEVNVNLLGALPAFRYGPDHQRLAPAGVPRRKDAGDAGRVALRHGLHRMAG